MLWGVHLLPPGSTVPIAMCTFYETLYSGQPLPLPPALVSSLHYNQLLLVTMQPTHVQVAGMGE